MPVKRSAGILLHRRREGKTEVLLVHPGGPFWAKKDAGAWSIPKGEIGDEEPLAAARRELKEETGLDVDGDFVPLSPVRQPSGKLIFAWVIAGDADPTLLRSNSFEMEWPPRSGKRREFPEVDRAEWFTMSVAREKILKGQLPLLDQLEAILSGTKI